MKFQGFANYLAKDGNVTIRVIATAYTKEMFISNLTVKRDYNINDLIALGLYNQKDIYNEMLEELDKQFNDDTNLVALGDLHVKVTGVRQNIKNTLTNLDYIHISNENIIPEFSKIELIGG